MKTAVIYHSIDLDGWMSAAIVRHYLESVYPNSTHIQEVPGGVGYRMSPIETMFNEVQVCYIGYNYGQPVPDLSEFDKIIMCDISFPAEVMNDLIKHQDNENFIWIDHHISAISSPDIKENWAKGLRSINFAACELAWQYFFPDSHMPEIVRLLGRYDCFGHKGTDEEMKVLEFQYGARLVIASVQEAYEHLLFGARNETCESDQVKTLLDKGETIYHYLTKDAQSSYKNKFDLLFPNPGDTNKQFVKFAVVNKERFNPINFGIDYHKEGYEGFACFYRRGDGKWSWSLYNDDGKVDCSKICKEWGGGGHKGAAGFVVDNLGSFITTNY